MVKYQNIIFYIFSINIIIIQSLVVLAKSDTNTQIIYPHYNRSSLATAYKNYAEYKQKTPDQLQSAQWIWDGTGQNCGCPMNITIQHFFKLSCLTSNIYLYINCDNSFQAYINGNKIASSPKILPTFQKQPVDTLSYKCDDILNLTIQAQNDNTNLDCCNSNPAGLIYTLWSDDCNGSLCQCNNLVYPTCYSLNCIGPVNYITDQTNQISKPNPIIQELSCRVCGIGFFLNLSTNYCNFCSGNCLSCNSTSYCLSCNNSNGLYLNTISNTCVDCKSIGYFIDSLTSLCNRCSPNCLICNSTSYCLYCNKSVGLYLNTISNTCVICNLEGYYIDSTTNLCNRCSPNCLTCNSSNYYCLSCNISAGLYLNMTNNYCTQCQQFIGYYINQSLNICMPCANNCTIYYKGSCNCVDDTNNNSISPSIIAGICIGGIVFIFILITIIYLYLHHSKMKANLITQSEYTKLTKSNKKFQINSQKIIQFNLVNCSICCGDNCDLITPCQHQFHVQCFKQWTNKNLYCPICQNKNIQTVKIAICKKCKIYEYFEISKKSLQNFGIKLEIHVCERSLYTMQKIQTS